MGRIPSSWAVASSLVWACLVSQLDAARDINGNHVSVLSDEAPIDNPNTFYPALHPCPTDCSDKTPSNWTIYTSTRRLAACSEPMLLDFAIHNPLDDPNTITKFQVCTSGNASSTSNALLITPEASRAEKRGSSLKKKTRQVAPVCVASAVESQVQLAFGRSGTTTAKGSELLETLDHLGAFFNDESRCNTSALFGYTSGVAVGVYIGPSLGKSTISSAIKELEQQVNSDGPSETMTVQLCGSGRNAHHVFGLAIDTTGSLAAVQKAVSSWANAECVPGLSSQLPSTSVWEAEAYLNIASNDTLANSTFLNDTLSTRFHPRQVQGHKLHIRGDCTTRTVISGDSCGSLAAGCGISATDFTKYNPASNLCSTLAAGQRVCCTEGTLPDIKPKPNADGSCASHIVQPGETCSFLAATYGLTPLLIERYNNGTKGTWGWTGCSNIQAKLNICLSTGTPPMPAPVENALCGPTVPGTEPSTTIELADLNPCPLNACCNIWGQCGITGDFCKEERGPSDNPGTAPIGVNGCVSSCGTDIEHKGNTPDSFNRIGYYESWNLNRDCLNMRVKNANTDGSYTHIHWAFMPIDTATWAPKLDDPYNQWEDFKALEGVKRIVSFGGWGYSTDPATYDILREAMSPTNREKFSDNVVKFLEDHGLDGADFDWEYPGALDIPGTPPGQEDDGVNYLKFLSTLHLKMPAKTSLSIAAPASYWYLKAFPIAKMASVLNYIVYMTYDLHGQWDAGNIYAQEGCEGGNCLRSHVNLTETMSVLSMITKAGVQTAIIYVGESSYGRSFGMAQPGCTGPDCTFLGDRDNSAAQPGMCTDTAGYISNAEINNIIATYDNVQSFHDGTSNSDILVYDDYEWVAYMTPTTKGTRRDLWQGYNFAGTIDWALDLQEFTGDDGFGDEDTDTDEVDWDWDWPNPPSTAGCGTTSAATLDDLAADGSVSEACRSVFTLQLLQRSLIDSMDRYNKLISDGYDGKFKTYASAVVDGAPTDVTNFMHDNGNKYFSCVVTEWQLCCSECDTLGFNYPNPCLYCFENGDCTTTYVGRRELPQILEIGGGEMATDLEVHAMPTDLEVRDIGPTKHPIIKYLNVSEPCPPDYSKRGIGAKTTDEDTVYWTLNPDSHDQFFADLFTEVGIEEEDIAFKDINRSTCLSGESTEECHANNWNFNFPQPSGYGKDDVSNPKDTVLNAKTVLDNIPDQLTDVLNHLADNSFYGDVDDVVDALALPVFMISDAIDNMDQIVDIADEIDRQKRMTIIFAFLSAIFFFIPIAGEIAGSLTAMAGIARIASLIGDLGNLAMDIYDVVNNPDNAPLLIFDTLGVVGSLRSVGSMSIASKARRAMSDDDVSKLGTSIKGRLDLIDKIKTSCPLKKRDVLEFEPVWPMSDLNGLGISGYLD